MRVTKRIIEYDAFQLTEQARWDQKAWPDWLLAAIRKCPDDYDAIYTAPDLRPARGRNEADTLVIRKGPGLLVHVNIGDWLMLEVSTGEIMRVDDSNFKQRFEPLQS
jgi:hypothetical protein